jgi:fatty acid-binding protein DegV
MATAKAYGIRAGTSQVVAVTHADAPDIAAQLQDGLRAAGCGDASILPMSPIVAVMRGARCRRRIFRQPREQN